MAELSFMCTKPVNSSADDVGRLFLARCTIAAMHRILKHLSVTTLLLCVGCAPRSTLTIRLATGYEGDVVIACTAESHGDVTVQADPNGQGSTTCPLVDPKLSVYRDGQQVTPSNLRWLKDDHAIIVAVEFDAK
jgi:hypothetical protein